MANLSALSAIAGALRGGLQGYQTANNNARQRELDALQAKRQEEDMALRKVAEARLAESNRLAAEARNEAIGLKREAAARREFQAPILSDINKNGGTQGALDALGMTDLYLDSPEYQRFPVEGELDGSEGLEQVADEEGTVVADPSSFVTSKQDVLKARAKALTQREGQAPTLPTLPNGRTPKAEEAYQIALARGKGRNEAGPAPTPNKPLSDKAIDAIGSDDAKIASIDKIVADALKMGEKYPGMWMAKANDLLRYVGQDDPETTALTAQFKQNVSTSVRAISGAAATDAERKFIKDQEPNEGDTLDSMLLKAYNVSRFAKWKRANNIANQKKAKRDVGGFASEAAPNPMEDRRPVSEILAEIKGSGGVSGPKGPAASLSGPTEVERKTLPNGEVWAKYSDGTFKKVSP